MARPRKGQGLRKRTGNALRRLFGMAPYDAAETNIRRIPELERSVIRQGLGRYSGVSPYQGRRGTYSKFDDMIKVLPPLGAAMVYRANTALAPDKSGRQVPSFRSDNQEIKDILDEMVWRLKLPVAGPEALMKLYRYGDEFRQIVVSQNRIEDWVRKEPSRMGVLLDEYGRVSGYCESKSALSSTNGPLWDERGKVAGRYLNGGLRPSIDGDDVNIYAPWEIQHLKLDTSQVYGPSLIADSEEAVQKLTWMLFTLVIARVTKSINQKEHRVDMSGLTTEEERLARIAKIMESNQVTSFLDSYSNLLTQKSPAEFIDDIYTMVFPNSNADVGVKIHQGQSNLDKIDDIELIMQFAVSPTGVPTRLLSMGKETIARAELNEQDSGLLRLCMMDQVRMHTLVYYPLCQIELALHGIDTSIIDNDYEIVLVDLDTTDRKKNGEIKKLLAETYTLLKKTGDFDDEFLQRNLYDLSIDEIDAMRKRVEAKRAEEERKLQAAKDAEMDRQIALGLSQKVEPANQPNEKKVS